MAPLAVEDDRTDLPGRSQSSGRPRDVGHPDVVVERDPVLRCGNGAPVEFQRPRPQALPGRIARCPRGREHSGSQKSLAPSAFTVSEIMLLLPEVRITKTFPGYWTPDVSRSSTALRFDSDRSLRG